MRAQDFKFDGRLEFAETPPASWYFDSEILAGEKTKIFGRTWQLVGRSEQVIEPGEYFTATVADEPIIVARGNDGQLRAFSNVCRHRAGQVAEGAGRRKSFQCLYHGWTYALDGRLTGTPEFAGVQCFEKEAHALPQFKIEIWNGLVFVNLDAEALPLVETFGDLTARVRHADMERMRLAARKDWYIDCNWKAYVDNYLEGYHIPYAHPSLNRAIDYPQYRTETFPFYSIQHSPLKTLDGREEAAQYFWVFPNLMINVYPDNFSTNLIIPVTPERTLTIFEWYFQDVESEAAQEERVRRTIEWSDEIQIEDIKLCEAVQRNLHSRTYTSGRYSVKRENGVHHFHGLLAERLQK